MHGRPIVGDAAPAILRYRGKKIPALVAGILFCAPLLQPAVHAADVMVRAESVISVVTADWNKDGSFDRAILLTSAIPPECR